MKNTIRLNTTLLALLGSISVQAGNTNYYYDLNGTTAGSGVTSGPTYVWNTTDSVWNTDSTGGGAGTIGKWVDLADMGFAPGTIDAATNSTVANFATASPVGSNYTVSIPAGEIRDMNAILVRDVVTLTGGFVRPQSFNTYNSGFIVRNPGGAPYSAVGGRLVLSNVTILVTNCDFVKCEANNFSGLIRFDGVNPGSKQYSVQNYATLDLGSYLDNNLIFTANYPYGSPMAALFFNGGGLNVVQGNGRLTLPLMPTDPFSGPYPWIGWNTGNPGAGGFAGRGGKLIVNLYGDGPKLTWGKDNFIPHGQPLILNSYYADSEVEFQNAIDLDGDQPGANRSIAVPTGANGNVTGPSFATISGPISGTGGIFKELNSGGYWQGKLVLSGANTYTGPTLVRQGRLVITSSHQGGGEFWINANANANLFLGVRVTSSTVAVPMSSLIFGYSGSPISNLEINYCVANTNGAIIATNLTVNGTGRIRLSGRLPVGQFPLIKYQGTIGGAGFGGLALYSLPAGVVATLVNNTGNSSVDLNVTYVSTPWPDNPSIANMNVAGGTVSFLATNGVPDCGCAVMSTTNVVLPDSSWTTSANGTFNSSGTFQFTAPASGNQQFYMLKQ